MTMEGWADVAREIMQTRPWAWTFFVAYILVSTFTVLNLFIAVVVNAMQEQVAADHRRDEDAAARETDEWRAQMLAQMSALRAELELVRNTVTER
jgi:voltage-gated sodium channel